jgi:hypothetical protein
MCTRALLKRPGSHFRKLVRSKQRADPAAVRNALAGTGRPGLWDVRLGPQCGAARSISVGLSCADIGFPDGTLRTVARARIRRLVDRFVRRPRVEVFVTTNAVAPARSETVPSGPSRHAVVSTKIDTHRLTW